MSYKIAFEFLEKDYLVEWYWLFLIMALVLCLVVRGYCNKLYKYSLINGKENLHAAILSYSPMIVYPSLTLIPFFALVLHYGQGHVPDLAMLTATAFIIPPLLAYRLLLPKFCGIHDKASLADLEK
jgi:FtsH-binding integral membrane protein